MSQDKLDSVVQMRYHAERAATDGERVAALAQATRRMERYGFTEEQVTVALETRKRNEIRKRGSWEDFFSQRRRPDPQPTTGWSAVWALNPPSATAVAKAYGLNEKHWRAWLRRKGYTDALRREAFSNQQDLEHLVRRFNRRRQRSY